MLLERAIFGACREGLDALRFLKASCPEHWGFTEACFIDNDPRVLGGELDGYSILTPKSAIACGLKEITVGILDFDRVSTQLRDLGFTGSITRFYSDAYFSEKSRKVGMAHIGRYSYFKPSTFLYNVRIGNYCHIGADCRLGLIGHDPQALTTYPLGLKSPEQTSIDLHETATKSRMNAAIIEDDVYIGEGVSLMAGITVGRGSIIGSKSLVTRDVDRYTVVGGVPSKQLRFRFEKYVIDELENSKWWEADIDEARAIMFTLTERLGTLSNDL